MITFSFDFIIFIKHNFVRSFLSSYFQFYFIIISIDSLDLLNRFKHFILGLPF